LLPGEVLARIGGDEFVAIVHRNHRTDLIHLARDCIAAIGEPLDSVGRKISVGVSLGIVQNGLGQAPTTLLRQADRALYEAKRHDAGAFCFAGDVLPEPGDSLVGNSSSSEQLAQSA
jgi:diguanylate cyclase (GGDEF)-like protein